jgi:hypothetical protein
MLSIIFIYFAAVNALGGEETGNNGKELKRIILNVPDALKSATKYKDMKVVVVGMFMGMDGRCKKPPNDRNDWMIQEKKGECIWARGLAPDGCSAITKLGVGKDVAVEGYLKLEKGNAILFSTRLQEVREEQNKKNKEQLEKNKRDLFEKRINEEAQRIIPLGDIAANPAVYTNSVRNVKGKYYPAKGHCTGKPPVDKSDWMFEDLFGNCMFVHGPRPVTDGKEMKPGSIVTIRAGIKQKNDGPKSIYYLESFPDDKKDAAKEKK